MEQVYRTISHIKDYRGGHNQWIDCELFNAGDYEKLLDTFLALRKSNEKVPAIEEIQKLKVVDRYVS